MTLDDLTGRFGGLPLILAGDFNARARALEQLPEQIVEGSALVSLRETADLTVNARGIALNSTLSSNGLILLNGRTPGDTPANFTYCGTGGNSTIDLVWTNLAGVSLINNLSVQQGHSASDHFPLSLSLNFSTSTQQTPPGQPRRETILMWKQEEATRYQHHLAWSSSVGVDFPSTPMDSLNESYIQATKNAAKEAGMLRDIRFPRTEKHVQPWFDDECKESRKVENELFKTCKLANFGATEKTHYLAAGKACKTMYKNKRKEMEKANLEALAATRNTTSFWRAVRKFRKYSYSPNPIPLPEWEAFYERMSPTRSLDATTYYGVLDPYMDKEITVEELQAALKASKPGKAPGPGGIRSEFIRSLPEN